MYNPERKNYLLDILNRIVCSVGDEVLFVEDNRGDVFLLSPPNLKIFLGGFQLRINNYGMGK